MALGRSLAVAAILVAAGWLVAAEESVPLYTNRDLEKFGPPSPVAGTPSPDEVVRQWDFVQEHLEREFSRIEALRRLEAERAALDATIREPEPQSGHLLLAPWSYSGWGSDFRAPLRVDHREELPWWDLRTARHGYIVPRTLGGEPVPSPRHQGAKPGPGHGAGRGPKGHR